MDKASLSQLFLVLLLIQNVGYTLLRRAVGKSASGSPSSMLIVGEVIKMSVSAAFTVRDKTPSDAPPGMARLPWLIGNGQQMFLPAFIYWCMNLLSYVALSRIDAAMFTICAQCKILTTALFSMLFLGRKISMTKWRALCCLVCGVITITEFSLQENARKHATDIPETQAKDMYEFMLGTAAVLLEVTLSGFCSIYFEKVVKSRKVKLTVFDRNVQLATYSIILYLPNFFWDGLFANWSFMTIIVSFLGAAGGILVALSVKYADSIMKSIATSGAIVFTALFGYLFLDGPMGLPTVVGSIVTICSIMNYTADQAGGKQPLPIFKQPGFDHGIKKLSGEENI